MRKRGLNVIALSAILALGGVVGVTLSSCGSTDNETTKYSVNYTASSDYTISIASGTQYEEGATVSFTVTAASGKVVKSVTVNGSPLVATNGTYSFRMPKSNVTIAVTVEDEAVVTYTFEGKLDGIYQEGQTLTATATVNDTSISDFTITATTGASLVKINEHSISLVAPGEVTIQFSTTFEGQALTDEISFTIEDSGLMTIAEIKDADVGSEVTFRAEVMVSGGTSAYLADSTGGIYVYNWSYNSDDTAINNKMWTVGDTVEVRALLKVNDNVNQDEKPLQISNYDGGRVEGTYAIKVDADITPMEPIQLDEDGYNNLDIKDAGNLYTFKAYYQSGAPVADKAADITFKIGNTGITLRTDGGSSRMYDNDIDSLIANWNEMALKKGDEVEITTALGWFYDPQFAYVSHGTTITKTGNKEDATTEVSYLPEILEMNSSGAIYTGRAIYMGRNDQAYDKGGMTYNAVYVADGSNYYMLYTVPQEMIDGLNLVPGQSIIEWDGETADYGGLKESRVSDIRGVNEDSNIKTPVVPTLNETSPLTLTKDLLSAKVKIEDAVVTEKTNDSHGNWTVLFTVNDAEYTLYLDSRYSDLTADYIKDLAVGDIFSTYSFVSISNGNLQFVYVDDFTIEGEVTPVLPESVELTAPKTELKMGESVQLSYTCVPTTVNVTPTFTSSNSNIASVNNNGMVTGVAQGKATITVEFSNGVKDTLDFTVTNEAVDSIKYSYTPAYYNEGDDTKGENSDMYGKIYGSVYGESLSDGNAVLEAINDTENERTEDVITSVSNIENVSTDSDPSAGIKLGSSKKAGSFDFTVSSAFSQIKLSVINWNGDKPNIAINDITQATTINDASTPEVLTFTFAEATTDFSLVSQQASKGRFVIVGIEFIK